MILHRFVLNFANKIGILKKTFNILTYQLNFFKVNLLDLVYDFVILVIVMMNGRFFVIILAYSITDRDMIYELGKGKSFVKMN